MLVKKRTIKIFFLLTVVLLSYYVYSRYFTEPIYQFKDDKFSYSQDRDIDYDINLVSANSSYDLYRVSFQSRPFLEEQTKIYGYLLMPKGTGIPGVVLLPGGGKTKDDELRLASNIAKLGYAVFTIDQRGVGETKGSYLSFNDDYKIFLQDKEPMQHLAVYDALAAFDILRDQKNINKDNIMISGESMGGRYALIAAALDKRIKGALIISSSGFHVPDKDNSETNYMRSIDPDNYIQDISPRNIVMFHCTNDTIVSVKDAQMTFNLAKEPKGFKEFEDCDHGYYEVMDDELKDGLNKLFTD